MKIVALLINAFLFPGIGSFLVGENKSGTWQVILMVVGFILTITLIGMIVGIPMMVAAWIWGLITVAKSDANVTPTVNVNANITKSE
jgi:TM2 domain-containing membrane protein YozV